MLVKFFKSILCAHSRESHTDDPSEHYEVVSYEIPPSETSETPLQNRKYLALDLDGTLVYTRTLKFEGAEPIIVSKFQRTVKCHISPRPYLKKFIKEMAKIYTIIIFTASPKGYATDVLKMYGLDKYVQRLLHRKDINKGWEGAAKDLRLLQVPLKDVILVDDLIANASYQPENVLIVQPYIGEKNDRVLLDLIPFLNDQCSLEDMSKVNDRYIAYLNALKQKKAQLKTEMENSELGAKGISKGANEIIEKVSICSECTKETETSYEKNEEVAPC